MDELFWFYYIVSGLVFASFLYDRENGYSANMLFSMIGFMLGGYIFPFFIGRLLRKYYDS